MRTRKGRLRGQPGLAEAPRKDSSVTGSRRGPAPASLGVCGRTDLSTLPALQPAAFNVLFCVVSDASRPKSSEFITSSRLVNSVKRLYCNVTREFTHKHRLLHICVRGTLQLTVLLGEVLCSSRARSAHAHPRPPGSRRRALRASGAFPRQPGRGLVRASV